jgi:hypothetical protein
MQLDLLRHESGRNLEAKPSTKSLFAKTRRPVRAPVGISIEFPKMDELIDGSRVALEITDKLFVRTAFLERRKPDLLIKLHRSAILPT